MAKQTRAKDSQLAFGPNYQTKLHFLAGWFGLMVFLSLGMGLEAMHGFKAGLYLDDENVTRRLMWTLAHVHGTLFSLVHIAFAASISILQLKFPKLASRCLYIAILAMPSGFFLGGIHFRGGDPGWGILLVPVGALALLVGVCHFYVGMLRALK